MYSNQTRPVLLHRYFVVFVGFWRWCISIRRTVFLDFIHRLVSQEQKKLKIMKDIFRFYVLSFIIFNFVCSWDTRRWIKSKNTIRSILMHHRQNPTKMIYGIFLSQSSVNVIHVMELSLSGVVKVSEDIFSPRTHLDSQFALYRSVTTGAVRHDFLSVNTHSRCERKAIDA
jgi:hypothetical protein